MVQEVTVTKEDSKGTAPERDLAPVTATVPALGSDMVKHPHMDQGLASIEPTKRKKTWGERRFDVVTYGGWALLGNEAASLAITESIKTREDGSPRIAHGLYKRFEKSVEGWAKPFERFQKPGFLRYLGDYIKGDTRSPLQGAHAPRLPYLLVATIGGMLVVPFIKDREDRKGEIVRKLDRKHYGQAHADSDPTLIEAHKEMDDAPKQSWGSLAKGRFVTVIFAALADLSFGWPEALSTKIFKNNATYQKFASLERISDAFADWSSAKVRPTNEKLFKKVVGNGTWLLTLSASLTVLFYGASKLFAKKRDERIERRQHGSLHDGLAADGADLPSEQPERVETMATKPQAQVSHIVRQSTVEQPAATLAQGA